MAEDPLAEVIARALPTTPQGVVGAAAGAVRSHITTILDAEAEAWVGQWEDSDAPHGANVAIDNLRAVLLGTTEEETDG